MLWGELGTVILTVLIFVGLTTVYIIDTINDPTNEHLASLIAYGYLFLFIMMATANLLLFWILRKKNQIHG